MEARRFEQHQNTKGHKNQGRKRGQTALPDLTNIPQVELTDIAITTRLSTAWWLAREDVAIYKFGSLVTNKLISHRYDYLKFLYLMSSLYPQSYIDHNAAWEFVGIIAKHFNQLVRRNVANSPIYSLMVDETTDRSTKIKVIIYIKYLVKDEKGNWKINIEFLDLVDPDTQSALSIKVIPLYFNTIADALDCY
jgi:hypothetical protein